MIEIQQIAALRTKLIFYLVSYPWRAIAYRMDMGVSTKARLGGTCQELLSGGVLVALQGAAIGQRLAPLGVRQTNPGLFPLQLLAPAFIGTGGVWLDDGYHPTVHLNNHHCTGAALAGPAWDGVLAGLEHLLRVSLCDVPNGAFTQDDAVVLDEFVHNPGKGQVGTKVRDGTLQRS